jgi:acetylglutamate kinase
MNVAAGVASRRVPRAKGHFGQERRFRSQYPRIVLKWGGAISRKRGAGSAYSGVASQVAALLRAGWRVLLVHGGGPRINEALTQRGISWEFCEGQRITTEPMLEVIEQVLKGEINSAWVRALLREGVPAFGWSGVDGHLLCGSVARPEWGRVGQVDRVYPEAIEALWRVVYGEGGESSRPARRSSAGFPEVTQDRLVPVPVIAPLAWCPEDGSLLNVNADLAAAALAVALRADALVYLTDQPGILDAQGHCRQSLSLGELRQEVVSGVITGGMQVKARAIDQALQGGVPTVCVGVGSETDRLAETLIQGRSWGTCCAGG